MKLSDLVDKFYAMYRVFSLNRRLSDINCFVPKSTVFYHKGLGVVMGGKVKLGESVQIYQNVTIGSRGIGIGGYPVIGDRVIIYPYSSVLGNVTIGADSIIGSHSLVLDDVPCNCLAVGVPARVVKRDIKRIVY